MIGIFGGSFDPVHRGHIALAQATLQIANLQAIYFVPLKALPGTCMHATDAQRVHMLQTALFPHPSLHLDLCELQRAGFSYSIDTVIAYRAAYPSQSIALIMGLDAFAGLSHWHRWNEILDYTHIIVADRAGVVSLVSGSVMASYQAAHSILDPAGLSDSRHGNIISLKLSLPYVSSSCIRQQIASGQDISADLPDGLDPYIKTQGLYQSGSNH